MIDYIMFFATKVIKTRNVNFSEYEFLYIVRDIESDSNLFICQVILLAIIFAYVCFFCLIVFIEFERKIDELRLNCIIRSILFV